MTDGCVLQLSVLLCTHRYTTKSHIKQTGRLPPLGGRVVCSARYVMRVSHRCVCVRERERKNERQMERETVCLLASFGVHLCMLSVTHHPLPPPITINSLTGIRNIPHTHSPPKFTPPYIKSGIRDQRMLKNLREMGLSVPTKIQVRVCALLSFDMYSVVE